MGFGMGIIVGHLISKDIYKKKVDDLTELLDDLGNDFATLSDELEGGDTGDGVEELVEASRGLVENVYINPVHLAHFGPDGPEDVAIVTPVSQEDRGDIFPIDYSEFDMTHQNDDGWEAANLYYYSLDNTFCDEDNDIITDPSSHIGDAGVEAVQLYNDSEPNLYFRNNPFRCDYEVIFIERSYAQEILGYEDDTEEGIARRRMTDADEEDLE